MAAFKLYIQKQAEKLSAELQKIIPRGSFPKHEVFLNSVRDSAAQVAHWICMGTPFRGTSWRLEHMHKACESLQETLRALPMLERMNITSADAIYRLQHEYSRLYESILRCAATELDRNPHYSGPYRSLAEMGIALREQEVHHGLRMHSKQKSIV